MDELDLLKRDWKEKEKELPKLTYDDIYKMIWKKSSSIVKWIFYISLGELLLGILVNLSLSDKENWERTKEAHLTEFTVIATIISFIIIFYFSYKFYKNYRAISVTDDARTLIENIIKTREIVKNYIRVSLFFGAVVMAFMIVFSVFNDPKVVEAISERTNGEPSLMFWAGIVVGSVIVISVVLVILWLFYQLLYGILLRRLHENYKELKKIEE